MGMDHHVHGPARNDDLAVRARRADVDGQDGPPVVTAHLRLVQPDRPTAVRPPETARRNQGIGLVAGRLERQHRALQGNGVPGGAAIVGGPQVTVEGPPIAGVGEADVAHVGIGAVLSAVTACGGRRRHHPVPASVAGMKDGRASVPGTGALAFDEGDP